MDYLMQDPVGGEKSGAKCPEGEYSGGEFSGGEFSEGENSCYHKKLFTLIKQFLFILTKSI